MKFKVLGLVLVITLLSISVFTLLNRETQNLDVNKAVTDSHCLGTQYSGAWFDVIVPNGFEAKPSLPSTTGEGYDSVWFINPKLDVAFYLYSPQWGGRPSDILDDPAIKNSNENIESNEDVITYTRSLIYKDGRIGKFTSTETVNYVSHLTTGYRANDSSFDDAAGQIYTCFIQSIQQFAD